jgi:hypothetical protein
VTAASRQDGSHKGRNHGTDAGHPPFRVTPTPVIDTRVWGKVVKGTVARAAVALPMKPRTVTRTVSRLTASLSLHAGVQPEWLTVSPGLSTQ